MKIYFRHKEKVKSFEYDEDRCLSATEKGFKLGFHPAHIDLIGQMLIRLHDNPFELELYNQGVDYYDIITHEWAEIGDEAETIKILAQAAINANNIKRAGAAKQWLISLLLSKDIVQVGKTFFKKMV